MKYNHINYELTPSDHRSPDGTTDRIGNKNMAHEMAIASNEDRTEIAHQRKVRKELIGALSLHNADQKYSKVDPEAVAEIRSSIVASTQEIKRLRDSANELEDEAAAEYEARESAGEDRVA